MKDRSSKVKFLGNADISRAQTFSVGSKLYPQDVWIPVSKDDIQELVDAGARHLFIFDPPLTDKGERPEKAEKPGKTKGGKT